MTQRVTYDAPDNALMNVPTHDMRHDTFRHTSHPRGRETPQRIDMDIFLGFHPPMWGPYHGAIGPDTRGKQSLTTKCHSLLLCKLKTEIGLWIKELPDVS